MQLGSPTFSSRAALIAGQGAQPIIGIQQQRMWYSCNVVFLQWRANPVYEGLGKAVEQVAGIVVLEALRAPVEAPFPWVIDGVYSEFNSGGWLVDLGVYEPTCHANNTRKRQSRPTIPRIMQ